MSRQPFRTPGQRAPVPTPHRQTLAARLTVLALTVALAAAGCSGGGPILAEAPAIHPTPPPTPVPTAGPSDPRPIVFPRDDGPHDRLTEWWYYTGHLVASDGRHFGFEYVVFRAERGTFPVSWASHLALTDESAGTFRYDQRTEVGPQVDLSRAGQGFDLALADIGPDGLPVAGGTTWTMAGVGGHDQLSAASTSAGFAIQLALDPGSLPPILHGADGWLDFGAGGGSYYYSRPRLSARGTLTLDGTALPVSGIAWFDHQWGDFIAVGAGGWDWFAVDLGDGSVVTLSLIRASDGSYPFVYGTYVAPDGTVTHLARSDFQVDVLGHWTSPHTGAVYPAGWRLTIPGQGLAITLQPTVADQELDTRASTGVVYWEGSQRVSATRDGQPVGGQAYVELTGYGPGPGATSPSPSP